MLTCAEDAGPHEWREKLALKDTLDSLADGLLEAGARHD
jgi:hypothetical protein